MAEVRDLILRRLAAVKNEVVGEAMGCDASHVSRISAGERGARLSPAGAGPRGAVQGCGHLIPRQTTTRKNRDGYFRSSHRARGAGSRTFDDAAPPARPGSHGLVSALRGARARGLPLVRAGMPRRLADRACMLSPAPHITRCASSRATTPQHRAMGPPTPSKLRVI